MEKKKYIIPQIKNEEMDTQEGLLQSSVGFGSDYSGGVHRSRKQLWEDEEDEYDEEY